jgi:NitT/TauT family transport system substrate-binding protein
MRAGGRHAVGRASGRVAAGLALTLLSLSLLAPAWGQSGPRASLRVGLVDHAVHYLPLYVAAEGFFAEEGVDVQFAVIPGGTRVAAALAAGSLDIGAIALDSTLAAIRGGHGIRAFYAPRMAIALSWFARAGIGGWPDLRGGTIGVSSFASRTDMVTRFALRRRGLEPGVDVNVIQLGDVATRLAALRSGRVDAVILHPPATYAAQALRLPLLGTSETEFGGLWPDTMFTARERTLAEQPAALRAFLRAYVRGVRRARTDRDGSIALLVARVKYSRADAERVYDEVLPSLDESGALLPPALADFWKIMAASSDMAEPWPEARFFDRRFVDTFEEWAPPR